MLLVAANGSDIYATLYPGAGCSNNVGLGDSVSVKVTLDECTQLPPIGEGLPDGTFEPYGLTTYDSQSSEYSTTYSLESDCSPLFVSDSDTIDTCMFLSIYDGTNPMDYSQRFSDAYDTDATVALDCTTGVVGEWWWYNQDGVATVASDAAADTVNGNSVAACIPAASEPTSQTFTCQAIKTAYKSQSCCNNPNNPFTVPTSSARRLLRSAPSGDSQVVDLVVSKLSNWNTLLNKGLISAQEYSTRRTRLLESLA